MEYSVTKMATPCDAGETSVEIYPRNNELVSLTGQQLIRRSRLFGEVPWSLRYWQQCLWAYEHSMQSSGGELAEERLWLLPAAVPRWHYEHSSSAKMALRTFYTDSSRKLPENHLKMVKEGKICKWEHCICESFCKYDRVKSLKWQPRSISKSAKVTSLVSVKGLSFV